MVPLQVFTVEWFQCICITIRRPVCWGQDVYTALSSKKREKFELAEQQRLIDEKKAAEEAELKRIEDEKQQRQLEHQLYLEGQELHQMQEEYRLQTLHDSFWGIDKQVRDIRQNLQRILNDQAISSRST